MPGRKPKLLQLLSEELLPEPETPGRKPGNQGRAEPGLDVVSCSGLQMDKLLMKESTWIEIARDL